MRKINYFKNCDLEYLVALNFWNKNRRKYTPNYWELDKAWNIVRSQEKLFFLPKRISKILVAKYNKLVVYYRFFDRLLNKNLANKGLTDIFDYYKFCTQIANFFTKYSENLDITSCFYCEMAYTGIYRQKSRTRRMFDVDHFFQQKQYPIFALSLYNFVPCCQFCNSRVKGRADFKSIYNLNKSITNKDIFYLLRISPTSPYYRFYENTEIKIYPNLPVKMEKNWQYTDDLDMYRVQFDSNQDGPYQKVIDVFQLNDRYNSISIKAHAKYLENLKKRYPNEYILEISTLLTNAGYPTTEEQIKNSIFHLDEKYALLRKMHNDILKN